MPSGKSLGRVLRARPKGFWTGTLDVSLRLKFTKDAALLDRPRKGIGCRLRVGVCRQA